MTDLDDAIASSAPVYYPSNLQAFWRELPPGESAAGNADSPRDLSSQLMDFNVEHSLDDGLPDTVTMTTSNDASGKLTASLTGRSGLRADTIAWRTGLAGGSGSGTSFTATLPADTTWGDYSIVAIAVNSNTVTVSDANADPELAYGWRLLGSQDDGSSIKVWLWGRDYYASAPSLSVALSGSASYSWVAGSVSARTANGFNQIPIRPGALISAGQTVSTTGHSTPSATLDRRGYLVGVFARVGGAAGWTAGVGTEINEAGSVVDIAMTTSTLRDAGSGNLTASSAAPTAVAVLMTLPLRIFDRLDMSARRFFSPLNNESPLYDWNRDTAPVTLDFNVLTASGVQGTQIFSGQMADIGMSGSDGKLDAVSRTRVALNASAPLPTISRRREGCTVDTVATWLMAQGGSYAGPGPSENTRLWYPMYDSVHPFMDGPLAYGAVYEATTADGGLFGVQPPETVSGPFVAGVAAHTDTVSTRFPIMQGDRVWPTRVPGKEGAFHDFLSQKNTKGRISFWVRGDAAASNPWVAANDSSRDYLFSWTLNQQYPNNAGILCGFTFRILNNRRIRVSMGQNSGYTFAEFVGSEIPTDGAWHFVGIAWDWSTSNGLLRIQVDGWTTTGSGFNNDVAYLPTSDAEWWAGGGYPLSVWFSKLPVSDVQLETGPECWSGNAFEDFERFWPAATDVNTVYRRQAIPVEAVASGTPVNSWETLAELARNTVSAYRCDEEDRYNFLPLEYFGEDAQMTPESVADTELNAGDLDVAQDPSKVRNVVTVNFPETRVDSSRQPVLTITSAVYLPRGTSVQTFPLDVPVVEVHGASDPYGGTSAMFELIRITPSQLLAPSTIPADNWMSVNSRQDGTGTQVSAPSVTGRIIAWDSSTVTIRFTNKLTVHAWLSHNTQDVPFLRIYGYGIRSNEAYTTVRAQSSVRRRGERPVSADMNWIQTREVAQDVAGKILNITSKPRPEITVRVVGDPRRKPGQLVTVDDSAETAAAGTWRILNITHTGDGAQYTQDLRMVRVNPVLIWGGTPGWGQAVWG